MTLQFIDNSSIDSNTRRLIRSHAAKGKNIGKGRPRRKPRPAEGSPLLSVGGPNEPLVARSENAQRITIERPHFDAVSLCSTFELSSTSRRMFRQVFSFIRVELYPRQLEIAIEHDMASSMWVRFIFVDEAYFHCIIAMVSAISGFPLIGKEDSAESLRHLAHTFRLVNEKLSGREATADTTFAAVVAMTQYYRLRGDHKQGLVHLDGLRHMACMRGGISHLAQTHPALARKIFRADLEFALNLGTPTKFSHADIPSDHIIKLLDNTTHTLSSLWLSTVFAQVPEDLREITFEIFKLAQSINAHTSSAQKIDGDLFHDVIIFLGYRLNAINPLSAPPISHGLSDMLCLGLQSFMASFFAGLNRKMPSLPKLSARIKSVAVEPSHTSQSWHKLRLWMLFIGRTTILKQCEDSWVLPDIITSIRYLGISSPGGLQETLSQFPWVNLLHDDVCERLYVKISTDLQIPPLLVI
ncbi:hypothetical protein BKA67DRAFT_536046 [Truncatella angustata]|uniref:Uncharacterized protein n=1 Tax=Truncatella angustata TaxID=152316 RepID=A0A9P8UMD7_9PEZI|nr:uncharacterized protein BKA67DRAFT_536046 [Truncatella angustata]KAH6654744.1 hypothetical protein BKA67DRAFT_536046 [Truncatella angustata]